MMSSKLEETALKLSTMAKVCNVDTISTPANWLTKAETENILKHDGAKDDKAIKNQVSSASSYEEF